MHPLEGPSLKVQRAIEHLDALKERRDTFGKGNTSEYVRQRRMNQTTGLGEFIFIMNTVLPDPPKEWGVIIGEIAHQIRSALDQVLWQVSKNRNPALPDNAKLYFPIKAKRSTYQSAIPFHLQYLTKRPQQARLRRAQPYFRRKDPFRAPLWIIDNIDIADKHITIPITPIYSWMRTVKLAPIDCQVEIISQLSTGQTVEPGTEFLRLRITEVLGPDPRVTMNADFRFAMLFGAFRTVPSGVPVVPIFEEAIQQVASLIEEFESDP
jgi:hypothetical protein